MINLWCLYVALVVADDFAADLICLSINRFFSIQMQKRLSEVKWSAKANKKFVYLYATGTKIVEIVE